MLICTSREIRCIQCNIWTIYLSMANLKGKHAVHPHRFLGTSWSWLSGSWTNFHHLTAEPHTFSFVIFLSSAVCVPLMRTHVVLKSRIWTERAFDERKYVEKKKPPKWAYVAHESSIRMIMSDFTALIVFYLHCARSFRAEANNWLVACVCSCGWIIHLTLPTWLNSAYLSISVMPL